VKYKNKRKYLTIGVTRPRRMLFVDVDSKNFDIYETKDGFHIVAQLKKAFDYRFKRLRVASKIDSKGKVVNPEPKLILCNCPKSHLDKRLKGKLQIYATVSR